MTTDAFLQACAERRRETMDRIGDDAMLIVFSAVEQQRNRDVHYPFRQNSDFRYLTEFPEPDSCLVLLPGRAAGEFVLFCRPRDPQREIWDGHRYGTEGAREVFAADESYDIADLDQRLPQLMRGRQRIVFALGENDEADERVLGALNALRAEARAGTVVPSGVDAVDAVLHEMRLIKRDEEVARMREAAEVSAEAHCAAMRATRAGRYEYEIAAELRYHFERAGMEPAYGSIVGGGANACVLHYVSNHERLADGDLLLVDAAAENAGYCADITRTWPVSGRYSDAQRQVYDIVLAAQLAAIAAVRPGNQWNDPHDAAVRVLTEGMVELGLLNGSVDTLIADQSYRRYYMHNTGHWLGMDVHDVGGYKQQGEWRPLEPGMTLTVEPGLYIPPDDEQAPAALRGMGIRIEDDVLVTDADPEVLTASVPKTADAIEALMAT